MTICAKLFLLCAVAGLLAVAGCSAVQEHDGSKPFKTVVNPGNKAFYNADGSFNAKAAKAAYYDMMVAFGYPIPPVLKTDALWVADFVQADYEKLGMAGVFWKNQSGKYGETGAKAYTGKFKGQSFGYLGHEIFLLPGQMLPEHNHDGGDQGYGPKMESWHIRHGSVTFFGEYNGGGEKPISEMPESERPWGYGQPWFKSKYYITKTIGEVYTLNDPESWHFQRAGKDGAIVAEYATYHNHVKFSKPGMKFASTEAKKSGK